MNVGIEIGGSKLQLVTGDESARIQERRRLTVNPTAGAAGIRRQIEQTLPELLRQNEVLAVGVGFGGPVDWRNGTVARSHQIEGWSGFELDRWLRELADVPVIVDNDANVAALGEATRGAGVGLNPVFYFNMGSGVGGGLVVEQRIYHGATPGEVEFGHLQLDRTGTTVESKCSGWAVDQKIRQLQASAPGSLLCKLTGRSTGGEARHLAAALHGGDASAEGILAEVAGNLAFALSHAVHLLHPEIIVMGGGLAQVGEPLRAAVQKALPGFLMEVFRPEPEIKLAVLGEDAVPVGALMLAQQNR